MVGAYLFRKSVITVGYDRIFSIHARNQEDIDPEQFCVMKDLTRLFVTMLDNVKLRKELALSRCA